MKTTVKAYGDDGRLLYIKRHNTGDIDGRMETIKRFKTAQCVEMIHSTNAGWHVRTPKGWDLMTEGEKARR